MPNTDLTHESAGMNRAAGRGLRAGIATLLAAVLVCGACGESVAQSVERSSGSPRDTASRSQSQALLRRISKRSLRNALDAAGVPWPDAGAIGNV